MTACWASFTLCHAHLDVTSRTIIRPSMESSGLDLNQSFMAWSGGCREAQLAAVDDCTSPHSDVRSPSSCPGPGRASRTLGGHEVAQIAHPVPAQNSGPIRSATRLGKVCTTCCAYGSLRCAVLAPSPIYLICLGRCAPCALRSARSRRSCRPSLGRQTRASRPTGHPVTTAGCNADRPRSPPGRA